MPFRPVFDQLLTWWSAIAGGVFVLVLAILLVAIVRNRQKVRANLPFAASENHRVEGGYVVLLGLVTAALVVGSFLALSRLNGGEGLAAPPAADPAPSAPPATTIDVTAFRWCWAFGYRQAPVSVTGTCTGDDTPTVIVPAGQPVQFDITSKDVVHGFWIPDLRTKMDAYPDHVNTLRLEFPTEGSWRGRCSEFCGTHHVSMDFVVRAVSPEKYQQFLDGTTA